MVRQEDDEVRRYCHIGTGNYNSATAVAYEDVGLFTADPAIGADIGELFNFLTGSAGPTTFRHIVVSPMSARAVLLAAIEDEARAGARGRIVLKTNSLTDPALIDALYRASGTGASIDLIVRGRCSLRPGVPGLSDNVRVRSIVGRYLEHSRIYRFGDGDGRPSQVLIGSCDLMERNLDRRVEVLVPIRDEAVASRLVDYLDGAVRDTTDAWALGPDGRWTRIVPDRAAERPPFSIQRHGQSLALESLESVRSPHVEGGAPSPPRLTVVPGALPDGAPGASNRAPPPSGSQRPVPGLEVVPADDRSRPARSLPIGRLTRRLLRRR